MKKCNNCNRKLLSGEFDCPNCDESDIIDDIMDIVTTGIIINSLFDDSSSISDSSSSLDSSFDGFGGGDFSGGGAGDSW
jgi:uncharacterized membrane protein YgcG